MPLRIFLPKLIQYRTSVWVFHLRVFCVRLEQFVLEEFYSYGEPNNAGHRNDADHTGGGTGGTRGAAQRFNGCVSRVGHAVDDGGGVAVFTRGCGVPDEPVLENSGLQSDSRGVVRLLSARHDSAGLLFPGWRSTAVFYCQTHRDGCALRGIIRARAVAFLVAGCAGCIPPLDGPLHDVFYFRRHALTDRVRIPVLVPTGIPFVDNGRGEVGLGLGCTLLDSVGILAGMGPISAGTREF